MGLPITASVLLTAAGNLASTTIDQNFPFAKATWSVDQIPDLTGKVVIVTGGNAGLGKETVKVLLSNNAKVYIASRSLEKSKQAIDELQEVTGKQAHFLRLDLADLAPVKEAAQEYIRLESRLDILYNNAGVLYPGIDQLTKQGFDMQFGVNTLGHFPFTKLLLPTLISTAKLSDDDYARVVTTSSFGHYVYPDIDFNTLKDSPVRRKLGESNLYSQTNFIKILFAKELAERYRAEGIVSFSLHPGTINTNLFWTVPAFARRLIAMIFPGPEKGALTQLRAGTDPDIVDWNGQYMKPWGRVGGAHKATENEALRRQIWEYMEEQVKSFC